MSRGVTLKIFNTWHGPGVDQSAVALKQGQKVPPVPAVTPIVFGSQDRSIEEDTQGAAAK